jgi:hypothetical protein
MISFKANGNKMVVAGCYEEMRTRHYQRILKEWDTKPLPENRDYFKLFTILSDSDFTSANLSVEDKISMENLVRWFVEQPFEFSKEFPKVMEFKGKVIILPKSIGDLGIGQNIFLHQQIKGTKFLEENISIALATFIQPLFDGAKFDSDRVKEIEKEILEMPIHLTYPIGFFLLSRLIKSGWKLKGTWHQILTNLRENLKRMLQGWQKSKDLVGMTSSH